MYTFLCSVKHIMHMDTLITCMITTVGDDGWGDVGGEIRTTDRPDVKLIISTFPRCVSECLALAGASYPTCS